MGSDAAAPARRAAASGLVIAGPPANFTDPRRTLLAGPEPGRQRGLGAAVDEDRTGKNADREWLRSQASCKEEDGHSRPASAPTVPPNNSAPSVWAAKATPIVSASGTRREAKVIRRSLPAKI